MPIPAPAAGCLPVHGAATVGTIPAGGPSPDEMPRGLAPGPRILIVDDSPDAADALSAVFRVHGRQVRTAYDGPGALVIADEWRPEVAILDIAMPGMDGYELARRLRAGPRGRDILLLALTRFAGDAYRRLSMEAGFDHHFVKPASPGSLVGAVASSGGRRPGTIDGACERGLS